MARGTATYSVTIWKVINILEHPVYRRGHLTKFGCDIHLPGTSYNLSLNTYQSSSNDNDNDDLGIYEHEDIEKLMIVAGVIVLVLNVICFITFRMNNVKL